MSDPDWDVIAREIGLPRDWRAFGCDSPEYMASSDSIYRRGEGFYCYPGSGAAPPCKFTTLDVEALFRHVHSKHGQL